MQYKQVPSNNPVLVTAAHLRIGLNVKRYVGWRPETASVRPDFQLDQGY